jgi:hypothetical protein
LFFGAVYKGVPSAAADAGVGEAAVDAAEPIERGGHRCLDRGGIGDIANASVNLAGAARHGRGGVSVLLGIAAPDRNVAPGRSQRLRDAETDSAIATGDDGDAAGEVENTCKRFHEAFPFGLARVKAASGGGQMSCYQPWTSAP